MFPEVVYRTVGQEGGTTLMDNGDVADPKSSLGHYAGSRAGGERAFAPTCSPDELAAPIRPSMPAIGLPEPIPTTGPGK